MTCSLKVANGMHGVKHEPRKRQDVVRAELDASSNICSGNFFEVRGIKDGSGRDRDQCHGISDGRIFVGTCGLCDFTSSGLEIRLRVGTMASWYCTASVYDLLAVDRHKSAYRTKIHLEKSFG